MLSLGFPWHIHETTISRQGFEMNFLKRYSLRTQFCICFLVVLIPMGLIFMIIPYRYSSAIITRMAREQTTETIEQITSSFDSYLELMVNKLEILGNSPVVQEELVAASSEVNQTSGNFYSRARQIRRLMLQEYYSISINDIEITGLNGAEYLVSVNNQHSAYDATALQSLAEESQGHWVLYDSSGQLQLAKLIKELQTGTPLGYVRISLRQDYLEKLVSGVTFGSDGMVMVIDENGHVLCGEHADYYAAVSHAVTGTQGSFDASVDRIRSMVIYNRSSNTGWTTIAFVPYRYLYRDLRSLQMIILFFSVLLFCASVFLSRLIGRLFVQPIEDTDNALLQFSTGDFTVRLDENRRDEIGQMNRVFNKTIADVQSLMHRVTQADILTREMEYKTLQSQMNPHFLYNTLDIINWMAFKKKDLDICNMVSAISSLTRASISRKQSIVSLEQELQYVKDYLYIQHVRYQNRLEVIYDVDASLYTQMIPKLIIEPIAENAVIHGIEDSEETNLISISAHRLDDDVLLCVSDTGVGMTQEKADSLLQEQQADSNDATYHTNLGIYAVNRRIKYLYGDSYGICIQSQPQKGTCVRIRIPYMEDSNELLNRYQSMLGTES